jgi:hypothetical protein
MIAHGGGGREEFEETVAGAKDAESGSKGLEHFLFNLPHHEMAPAPSSMGNECWKV